MNIQQIINIIQCITAVLLIIVILIQQKGSGLGSAFGGGDFYATKRGAEKTVFVSSIILSILFLGLALASFLLQK